MDFAPTGNQTEAGKQARIFKMARRRWRAFAIFRFRRRAAVSGFVVFVPRRGNTDPSGYGATETCIVSANRPDNNRVGSVGIPFGRWK